MITKKKKKAAKKIKKVNPKKVNIPDGIMSFGQLLHNIMQFDPAKYKK